MSSTVLVWVEPVGDGFAAASLGALTKGRELASALGGDLVAVVTGGEATAAAAAGLGAHGATRVLTATGDRFAGGAAAPAVDAVATAAAAVEPAVVLLGATVLGAEVGGGLAGRLGVGITNDVTDARVDGGEVVLVRPALDDSVLVDCGFQGTGTHGVRGIALVRPGSVALSPNGGSATVETLDVPETADRRPVSVTPLPSPDSTGVDITQADVLVGAGRGFGGPEKLGVAETLADALGGTVATTRAVVDAGWYDYATQVGQTGKTVTPKLYVALGISGAIQHKIGMQSSGTVVAVNKDPNAPIFDFADFGVVGDLFDIAPKLEAALRARKG